MRLASAVAVVFVGAVLGATTSGASTPRFDARWSALQACLTTTEHGSLSDGIHPNGFVAVTSPGHLQIEGGGLAATVVYEGTFARAEAQAKRTKEDLHPAYPPGHGAGFAIGNVLFYFSALSGSVQEEVVTSCLSKVYKGQPKWPSNMNLSKLPFSGQGGPPEP